MSSSNLKAMRSLTVALLMSAALNSATAQSSTDFDGYTPPPLDPTSSFATDGGTLSVTASPSATTTDSIAPPPITPSSSDTSTVSSSSPTSSMSSGSSSHSGAIAGGVVGGLVVLGILLGLAFLYFRRQGSYYRGRTGRDGPAVPPSPRLRPQWLDAIGLGGGKDKDKESDGVSGSGGMMFTKHPRAQRLGSVDGQTATLDGQGRQRAPTATSDDAHEMTSATAYAAGRSASRAGGATSAPMGQDRSSRSSIGGTLANGRTSYDLNVFNSHSNINGSKPTSTRRPSDPFASDASFSTTANTYGGSSDLTRAISTTRPLRKPAPKYDETLESLSPTAPQGTSPRNSSKPPVSGLPRTRTSSNSSSMRVQAAANNVNGHSSSRSSLDVPAPELSHKSSAGTLGGAFKFAGEKEGITHYLMPDPPAAPVE